MSERPQTGKSTTHSQYVDFHPMSEWKEEAESSVLLVHLSDFTKEQIRITCVHPSGIVRVKAERKLEENKWSRCNKAFSIPNNCKKDKIQAKWQNGILFVTMPKEKVDHHEFHPKKQQESSSDTVGQDPKSSSDFQQASAAEHDPKHAQDHQKDRNESSKAATSGKADYMKNFDTLTAAETKEKKSMKGMATTEQTEEKKLMINMGVAVLVIVALGAYICHSFRSKPED